MDFNINYVLEQLTEKNVNIIFIKTIELNNKIYELERSRICFGNSFLGRQQIADQLPEQYVKAILEIWGEEPLLIDPEPSD